MKKIIVVISVLFLLIGCATESQFTASSTKNKLPKVYKIDLDNDGLEENVKIEDLSSSWVISITRRDKSEVGSLKAEGHLVRVEFIDLKQDGYQQIAVSYYDPEKLSYLTVHGLKNEKLSQVFSISSKCGVDAELGQGLARIRVGKPQPGYSECSNDNMIVWDAWVWSGDKFIKER